MKRLLIIVALLAGCSEYITPTIYREAEARCVTLGGLAGVSMTYSRNYYFVEAGCQNGSLVKFTMGRRRD